LKKKSPSLKDFFVGLSGKSKLIIYLLSSENRTFDHIRTMTVGDLLSLRDSIDQGAPDLIDVVDNLSTGRDVNETAFHYTSGRSYSESRIKDILIRAHAQAGREYKGLKHFQETVSQK
jgi:hypothetical protein